MTEELRYGIRPMGEDDISAVARLQAEVMPSPWSRGDFANSLSAGHLCLVVSDVALYRQFGFQAIGRRADYYATPEGRADALVMQSEWVHKS